YVVENEVVGLMGIQDKTDVHLVRHAYVRTKHRGRGIGALLLQELVRDSTKPISIGTWQAAHWAIGFYRKHGFSLTDEEEKNQLLRRYWDLPDRQIETSVVLADERYRSRGSHL